MNTMKKCLFGGALVGAGLCSTAVAGEFQWGSSNSYNSLINLLPGGYSFFATAAGGWNEGISNSPSYASTVGGDLGIDILAYSGIAQGPIGNAYVFHTGLDFTVSDNMMATINWDVSNDSYNSGSGVSYAFITDSGGTIFSMDGSSATGTTSLTLLSTETYTLKVFILSGPGISGLSFFNMTENTVAAVPLPPAAFAGLGMLAGLGAYRRIRR